MERRWAIGLLRLAATAAVLAAGAIYLHRHRAELAVLSEVTLPELAALTAALLLFFVVTGYTLRLLAGLLSTPLEPSEWIGLTFLGNALNYLGPTRLGVVAKAAYLKRKGLALSRFSALLAAHSLLFLFASGLLGLGVLALVRPPDGAPLLAAACGLLVAGVAVVALLPAPRFRRAGRLWRLLDSAAEGLGEIRRQRRGVAAVAATVVAQHAAAAACCWLSFRALGFPIDWPVAVALAVFVAIGNAFAVTPNNIGVQEVIMAYVYDAAGMEFSAGLLGAALIRAVHVAATFALAPLFVPRMLRTAGLTVATLLGRR